MLGACIPNRRQTFQQKSFELDPSNDVAPRSLTNKDCHAPCDHVLSASALSALKKCSVADLSAKRQRSVAKLSTKRIFSFAKWAFLVANGRMAADFSSPAHGTEDICSPSFWRVLSFSVQFVFTSAETLKRNEPLVVLVRKTHSNQQDGFSCTISCLHEPVLAYLIRREKR